MRAGTKYTLIGMAAFLAVITVTLAVIDGGALKGPAERLASRLSGRPVSIAGDLELHLLSLTPSLRVTGLRIGNPAWAGGGYLAEVESLYVELRVPSLLTGDIVLPRVSVDRPRVRLYRDASGRANWGDARRGATARDEPPDLPAVQRFVLRGGRLQLDDRERKLSLQARLSADESGAGRSEPFKLEGDGTINGQAFVLTTSGGPLINIDPDRPYPFDLDVRAGETRVRAHGSIDRPFDLGRVTAALRIAGPDLADLYYLTALALPNSPPYELAGTLRRSGTRFDVRGLTGKWGDSDLRGAITIETSGERPLLSGDLASTRLDFDDLGATLGGTPSTRTGETASAQQKEVARAMAAERRLFPDAKLDVTRIRAMNAAVSYRADAVNAQKLPLRKVAVKLDLRNGVLVASPLHFQFPQGAISGTVRLDATREVPRTTLDLRLEQLRLEEFLKKTDGPPAIAGLMQGRAQLAGTGSSVHAVASTADGVVTVVVPHGEIRSAFAELTGINVARGLGLLIRNDKEQASLRCGVASFKVDDGTLYADRIIVDTDDVLITGGGKVDLETERFDLDLKGRPKKLRLVRVRAPIEMTGPLRKPEFGVEAEDAVGQAGVAAALGALFAPLAAIVAFVDPGLAEDANCRELLAQARAEGGGARTAAAAGAKSKSRH